jgi:hypothetical protein
LENKLKESLKPVLKFMLLLLVIGVNIYPMACLSWGIPKPTVSSSAVPSTPTKPSVAPSATNSPTSSPSK